MLPLHLNKRLPQLSSCRLNEVGQEAGTAMFAHSGWRSPQCSVLCLFHLRIPPESQSWAWLCVLFLSGPQDESIASYKPKEHVLFCKESDNIYILIFWSRNLLCVDFRETTMTIILNKKKKNPEWLLHSCLCVLLLICWSIKKENLSGTAIMYNWIPFYTLSLFHATVHLMNASFLN